MVLFCQNRAKENEMNYVDKSCLYKEFSKAKSLKLSYIASNELKISLCVLWMVKVDVLPVGGLMLMSVNE